MIKLFIVFALLFSCSTSKRQLLKIKFDEFQQSSNVWSKKISVKLKSSLKKYSEGKVLRNGRIYGLFAKSLNLQAINIKELIQRAKDDDCKVINDYIRDWRTKEIIIYNNQKLPMVFLVCPDASLIRLKLQGNPLNKFRPWPHCSKSVRFAVDSDYKDFSQEAFKVDNDGNPIPKHPKDLSEKALADAWAEDAHTDISNQ